jgi:hypothetical protein
LGEKLALIVDASLENPPVRHGWAFVSGAGPSKEEQPEYLSQRERIQSITFLD